MPAREQFALLNCYIARAQDDWEGVLGQIRSAGEPSPDLKWLEIRAPGELGRVEEMTMTYVWAESDLSADDRIFCRLQGRELGARGAKYELNAHTRYSGPHHSKGLLALAMLPDFGAAALPGPSVTKNQRGQNRSAF